ncbi:MAG: RNA polymerase subunit sigma-24 [Bacteroidetes bacterium GWF2_29_10]|nr:MAG: RNA polymerase subunit sigma-24 [Bacteroidetes bacterium GWF2_29_10]
MEIGVNLTDKALRDYKLVQRAVCGEQKAYAELMKHYKDSIYFMLLKMTNNEDDAEDLTIEAFGKAFKKLEQYTPDFAFSTWLFRIASNNCIDFIRKKRKDMVSIDKQWEHEDGGEMSIDIISESLDPEENYIKKQKIQYLQDIVQKLKPQYRTLVEMRYFQELSYEEISVELNLPLGTVKAQLFRAREQLHCLLKNKQYNI